MTGLTEKMLAVHDALAAKGFPHSIGGAIALGYCVLEARATQDIDVNVFVRPERTRAVFAALPPEITVRGSDLEHAERDGQVRVRWDATPVDLFFSVLPFHDDVERHVRQVPFGGRTIPVLSCTALAVFKAMFDRPQDWVDIENMVEARSIDLDEAERWVAEMVGAGDQRAEKLDALRPGP